MIRTGITFTIKEMAEIAIAIDERRKKHSKTFNTLKETDDIYDVYLRALVDMNRILDKIYGDDEEE